MWKRIAPAAPLPFAQHRRSRAYRGQSAFLLRQSDILIAAANPDEPDKAGGTLETVREALTFDLPVIFIHTGKPTIDQAIYLIEPGDSLPNELAEVPPNAAEREIRLKAWVTQLTADPDNGLATDSPHGAEYRKHGESLLTEFFDHGDTPASSLSDLIQLNSGFHMRSHFVNPSPYVVVAVGARLFKSKRTFEFNSNRSAVFSSRHDLQSLVDGSDRSLWC